MTLYLGFEILLLLLLFKRKESTFGYCALSIALALTGVFRNDSVGLDIGNYINEFNQHARASWKEAIFNSEYSFSIYCKFLGFLGIDKYGFLIVTALLFAVLVAVAIKKNRCRPILTLYLYYTTGLYVQSFCIIRQSIAIAVFLIAYASMQESLKGKRLSLKFWGGLFIAAGFHPTVLVFAVLPFMARFYEKKKNMRPWMFLRDGLLFMISVLAVFSWLFPMVLQHTTSKYASLYGGGYVTGTFGNLKSGLLLLTVYVVFYMAFQNNWKQLERLDYIMAGTNITLAFTFASLSIASSTLGRMNLFVEGLMVATLDKLLKRYTPPNFCILLFFFFYYILYLIRDSIGVTPYVSSIAF